MKQIHSKAIILQEDDEFSDVSMAKINSKGLELYPAVCKTISLSLDELRAVVREIEELANERR